MSTSENRPEHAPELSHPPAGRRRLVAAVFGLGVLVGVGLTSLPAWAPGAPPADPSILPVRGTGPAPGFAPNVAPPAPIAEPPAENRAVSGREVAAAAHAVTASIRGNQVYGSGVVIGPRHVLTCLHVVESMRTIEVSVAERVPQPARVVERDSVLDLAVLELTRAEARYAQLGSATELSMGDRVFAMGAPRNMGFSLAAGIVSYTGRAYSDVYFVQTDIPTNAGNSGGPVLDEQGRVVGISSFILRDTQGLAFALPIDYAYRRFAQYFGAAFDAQPFEAWLADRAQPEQKMAARQPATH